MASVPSAGCLLAKNQYYRSKCSGSRARPGEGGWPSPPPPRPEPMSGFYRSWKVIRLPELIDKCWWIKSFFHSEPSPPTVGRKTLSAS
ncbi:PDPFL protein, partial [Psophia crepitans]|nr:PDPFL protein [Psophia crepitans]